MGRKTYLKIVMPSAPTVSFAPYDSQTIGLTTWDEAATIDGVTYHPARFALGDGTSTGDFSKGKGGLALGNQIASLEVENIFSGGLLKNYVDAGTIPLVGAVVTILDGVSATPQTWVLQEPSGDGPVLSFKLCTPGYLNQKRLQFAAMRYDGAVTVGLVVGDAEVQDIDATGRYKGVAVPTPSINQSKTIVRDRFLTNLGSPDNIGQSGYVTKEKADSFALGTFNFSFVNQSARDSFFDEYFSRSTKLRNSAVIITNGSSSEIVCWVDKDGLITFYNGAVKNSENNSVIDIATYSGELTEPNSTYLKVVNSKNPICGGASSIKGFYSKNKDLNEYGTVSVDGISFLEDGILYFSPKWVTDDGFVAWIDIVGGKISWSDYSQENRNFAAEGTGFFGDTKNIATESSKDTLGFDDNPPFEYVINAGKTSQTIKLGINFHTSLKDTDIRADFDKIVLDYHSRIVGVPRGSDNRFFWPRFFINTSTIVTSSGFDYKTTRFGKFFLNSQERFFKSFSELNNNTGYIQLYSPASDSSSSIYVGVYAICFYAIVKFSFGSNPAVVVPGNFPGTSNPTTTPTLAAAQLAAWLGLSNISLTGGITPTAGTWGEYLGEDPSSTNSDDTTAAKERLSSLLQEACIYGAETGGTVALPDVEVAEHPSTPSSSIDDVVTIPQFTYCYAGTSAQFTAKILNVDESFDISKGDGYYWGGWQEKDACHLSASPGSAVLAMCQLEDCISIVCADGYLRCSYDGGETWLQAITADAPTSAAMASGGGIMLATFSYAGETNEYLSADAGRTWALAETMTGVIIFGAYYDSTTSRFWICGKDADGNAAVWYATYGNAWTKIIATGDALSARSVLAVGDDIFITVQISGAWSIFHNTISGGGSIWALQRLGSHDSWPDAPCLAYWGGKIRIAIGPILWSSSDFSAWVSVPLPASMTAFATDGKVVSAVTLNTGTFVDGTRIAYSRDQGATWRIVRVSSEGTAWTQPTYSASAFIWDDDAYCFRFAAWGPTRIIALGDPSVLDVWIQCREAYLATSTLATDTFDKRGLYDASELVRWLLDCKDGTDTEYQQPFIKWITRPARFVIVRGKYQSIVDQLSVAAGLPITIPRKMLTYSGYDQNLPTRGIVSKATHTLSGTDAGLSEIEIIMPPL